MSGIPRALLEDAYGIAIIPNVVKGSFIVGASFGNGVLLIRDENGNWMAPVFVSLTGGNVGWQVGVQATDVILVFKTRKSIDGILAGKFTLGADAAIAAGPVGRKAAAATDGRLQAEIYSYSRARGLFAGVSIDGSAIQLDHLANATYYRSPGPGQPLLVPPSAVQLVEEVAAYSLTQPTQSSQFASPARIQVHPSQAAMVPGQSATGQPGALRKQLASTSPNLYKLLDGQWQSYLALPSQVFGDNEHPAVDSLRQCLARFDMVAGDPQYRGLAWRPEFQSTHALLQLYVGALSDERPRLQLPPPPGAGP
jgi:lipid-binding SYLF domain-containing protein